MSHLRPAPVIAITDTFHIDYCNGQITRNYWEIFFSLTYIFSFTQFYFRWRVALIHIGLPLYVTLNLPKWKLLQYSLHFTPAFGKWTFEAKYKSGSWERLTFYPLTTASVQPVLKLTINIQLWTFPVITLPKWVCSRRRTILRLLIVYLTIMEHSRGNLYLLFVDYLDLLIKTRSFIVNPLIYLNIQCNV